MSYFLNITIVITCLLSSLSTFAAERHNTSLIHSLANGMMWSALLHFESRFFSSERSAIHDPDYFYSPQGMYNREAELMATLQAFTDDPQQQCRFPARARYLQRYFSDITPQRCPEFDDFATVVNAQSISLMYASGYLGNPASMYGHVFLKFNNPQQHTLLDNTFNYGARFPPNENPFVYIAKGIFGGYDGYFANQEYHHQTLTYNQTELRDLWEYQLNISQQDVELILAHLWELEHVPMTYYFFKQNCAYQLARLLEAVLHVDLIASGKIWVMPYDLIMMLDRQDNRSLIHEVYFHRSRQESLYSKYAQLSFDEQAELTTLLQLSAEDAQARLLNLPQHNAKRIIDTLYDYYAYLESRNDQLTHEQRAMRTVALDTRLQLPVGRSDFIEITKTPPHYAQDTSLLQISQRYDRQFGASITGRFRANYYDLLSVNSARIPFSELSTFDLRATHYFKNEKTRLEELTLLRIINLNAAKTGLPADTGYAWKVAAGYQRLRLDSGLEGAVYSEGFLGKSFAFNQDTAVYAALSGLLTSKNSLGGYIAVGPEVGGVMHVSPFYAVAFSLQHQSFTNDWSKQRTTAQLEQRFFNHKRFDMRSLIRYDRQVEYSIAISFYY